MIGLVTGVVAGIALGMISGLLPGVHVNMMAGGLLAVQTVLVPFFGMEMIATAMVAALITHSFLDTIPSTFLGIPDPDTALCTKAPEYPANVLHGSRHGTGYSLLIWHSGVLRRQ
jgi:putative membrane protein